MKGYDWMQLGPQERISVGDTTDLIPKGGTVEMYSLFELEHPLIREAGIKWVTFFDIGNTFDGFPSGNDNPFTLRADYGLGIRWFSPIGPLRFEWGFPVGRKPDESSPVFWFYIGPPF